jgi:hypothetical protein
VQLVSPAATSLPHQRFELTLWDASVGGPKPVTHCSESSSSLKALCQKRFSSSYSF